MISMIMYSWTLFNSAMIQLMNEWTDTVDWFVDCRLYTSDLKRSEIYWHWENMWENSKHFVLQTCPLGTGLAQLFIVLVAEMVVSFLINSQQISFKATQMSFHPPPRYYVMTEIKCQRCVTSHRIGITRDSADAGLSAWPQGFDQDN